MLGEIIAFIAGAMAGVTLMCIVSVTPKGHQEDEEQMECLKEWNNKHGSASCEISVADFPWRAEETLQALVS